MLATDANGNPIQVLHPIDGSLQRLAPTAGAAARVTNAFAARAKVVGIRIRSATGIGHVRFGDVTVAGVVADLPLTIDDGWMFFSIVGKAANGSKKSVTHVSVYAETANVSADVVELE